jgi:hypothetical protein
MNIMASSGNPQQLQNTGEPNAGSFRSRNLCQTNPLERIAVSDQNVTDPVEAEIEREVSPIADHTMMAFIFQGVSPVALSRFSASSAGRASRCRASKQCLRASTARSHFWIFACGQQQGGAGVPQVVKADVRHLSLH